MPSVLQAKKYYLSVLRFISRTSNFVSLEAIFEIPSYSKQRWFTFLRFVLSFRQGNISIWFHMLPLLFVVWNAEEMIFNRHTKQFFEFYWAWDIYVFLVTLTYEKFNARKNSIYSFIIFITLIIALNIPSSYSVVSFRINMGSWIFDTTVRKIIDACSSSASFNVFLHTSFLKPFPLFRHALFSTFSIDSWVML